MNHPYAVTSPQRPDDIMPVPWHERPLSDIGANSKVVEAAYEMGIRTLADLEGLTDWTTIPGVGAVTAEKMEAVYRAYRGEA